MMKIMKREFSIIILFILSVMVTACGPSDDKVAEAQQKYADLVQIHNQVAEAHKNVADNSLDEDLRELREKITEVEGYDLNEMKEEEIDLLIEIMDTLILSYEDFLTALMDIKGTEDAAVLTPVSITVVNQTDFSFTELKLYENGSAGVHENVLSGLGELAPGRTLAGLVVQRDTDNTPWVLALKDADDIAYEFELSVENYDEEGVRLSLIYDAEQKEISLNLQ